MRIGEIHDKLIKYRGTDISPTYIVSRWSNTRYFGDISPKYRDIFFLAYGSLAHVPVFEYPSGCIIGNRLKSFQLKVLEELSRSLKL